MSNNQYSAWSMDVHAPGVWVMYNNDDATSKPVSICVLNDWYT